MTELRFYHLTQTPLEKALPRLLVKVLEAGHRVVVLAPDEPTLTQLDSVMWTFSTNQFVPHGTHKDKYPANEQPVFITLEEENPNNADVVVVVGDRQPELLKDMKIGIDMFDGGDENQVTNARKRWKEYKSSGHECSYWQQNPKGGWEKAA